MVRCGRADAGQVAELLNSAFALLAVRVVHVPESDYHPLEAEARRRIPRDPDDWPLVALALHLGGAPILTLDGDFLGCGLVTWTPDTLHARTSGCSWPTRRVRADGPRQSGFRMTPPGQTRAGRSR